MTNVKKSVGMSFQYFSEQLKHNMVNFERRIFAVLYAYSQESGKKMMDYAKKNAKWTDRSGDARRGLNYQVERNDDNFKIYVCQGVHYGKWLELISGKKWAILWPTIQAMSPKVISGMNKLIEKAGI